KSAGDAVRPGDNLFEIETDKVSMEVPSTTAGVLAEIRVGTGEVAPVGAIVAVISGAAGAAALSPTERTSAPPKSPASPPRVASAGPAGVATVAAAPVPGDPVKLDPFFEVRTPERNYGPARLAGGTVTTPLARRLAGENGIDLARLAGSGPHGLIVARVVESAVATNAQPVAVVGASVPTRWHSEAVAREL